MLFVRDVQGVSDRRKEGRTVLGGRLLGSLWQDVMPEVFGKCWDMCDR